MGLKELIKQALFEGYATSELNIGTMLLCIVISACAGLYIYFIYRLVNKNSFYNRNFNMSLIELSVITAAIILTIQSNVIVSLGMVGALSIVRFRTAIKDPMDLVFLFWSISVGIICGAGFAMIAAIASLVLTIVVILNNVLRREKNPLVLVVNSDSYIEDKITGILGMYCSAWKVSARSITGTNTNMAIELRTDSPQELVKAIIDLDHVTSASLLEHGGEVTA